MNHNNRKITSILFFVIMIFFQSILSSQNMENNLTEVYALNYISPSDLKESLLLDKVTSEGYALKIRDSVVFIRFNESNNQVLLRGSENLIQEAKELIQFFDVPPRQIIIEVKIVEINNEKFDEMGLDWQDLLDQSIFGITYNLDKIKSKEEINYEGNPEQMSYTDRDINEDRTNTRISGSLGRIAIGDFINIIKETGSGKIINIPHILTINNKTGKILDGKRVTYISRYSSYTNLYETQEMTAGLSLTVTPSIGESGYLTLNVIAKLTYLEQYKTVDSPIESGQILENIVIAKDQEPILLGGFKQTETTRIRRRFPILGTILPFIFSKHVNIEVTKNILLILTPRIIDLNPTEIPEYE